MFFVMAEIGNVRLKRRAFAKILRLNFAKIDTPQDTAKAANRATPPTRERQMSRFPRNTLRPPFWIWSSK